MADLAKASQAVDRSKFLNKILLVFHLVFIAYLVTLINHSQEIALTKFLQLRNIAYVVYIGLFLVIGLFIVTKKKMLVNNYVSLLVVSLMLTTFSYLLAKIVADLLRLFNLL